MRPDNPLTNAYLERHPREAARTLEGLPAPMAAGFLAAAEPGRAAPVLARMVAPAAAAVVQSMPARGAAAVLALLPEAAAERLLRRLPRPRTDELLARLQAPAARRLRRRLRQPLGVVGAAAEQAPFLLPEDIAVAEAVRRLRGSSERGCEVHVVDRDQRPVGWVAVADLLRAGGETRLHELMAPEPAVFDFHTRLRTAADHRVWERLRSVPTVDAEGRVAGVVRYTDLQTALRGQEGRAGAAAGAEQGLALAEMMWLGLAGLLTALLAEGGPRRGVAKEASADE